MVINVAAFGWHATLFLGWGTLVGGFVVAAIAALVSKHFLAAADPN